MTKLTNGSIPKCPKITETMKHFYRLCNPTSAVFWFQAVINIKISLHNQHSFRTRMSFNFIIYFSQCVACTCRRDFPPTKCTGRAVSIALHTPQLGGPTLSQGPKIHSRQNLIPQRKLRPQYWNMKHDISVKLGGPLKETCMLIHYSYFGPLWKQGIYTLQLLLWGPLWKQSSLHKHYSCCCASLKG